MKRRTLGNLMAGALLASVLVLQPYVPAQAADDSWEEYIEYDADGEWAVTEEDDMERVYEGEEIPPTEVHWEAPGTVAFRPATTDAITYRTEIYKNDKLIGTLGSSTVYKFIDEDGFYRGDSAALFFEGDGVYTVKVFVGSPNNKIYAESSDSIEWTQPEERVATPKNLRWECRDGKYYAVCDAGEQASKYNFTIYEDDAKLISATTTKSEYNATSKIGDINAHKYTFTVRVSSADLTKYGNSKVTVKSAVLSEESKEDPIVVTADNIFSEEAAVAGVALPDGQHTLKVERNEEGNYTAATITGADGSVDAEMDSYIANIVKKYDAAGNPEEFYSLVFTDGKWDLSYDSATMGAYEYLGESYMVVSGVINQSANGLQYTGDVAGWKFLAAGKVVRDKAGLVMYQDEWFWIDETGSCDQNYAAIVKWQNADFLVHGGRLRTDFTGFTYDPQNENMWYHIEKGQVWGDGEITDASIEGGEITRTVVKGVVQ